MTPSSGRLIAEMAATQIAADDTEPRPVGGLAEQAAAVGQDQDVDEDHRGDEALQHLGADEERDQVDRGQRERGPDDLHGEQAEEQSRLGEPPGHRPFDAECLADRVGGGQRTTAPASADAPIRPIANSGPAPPATGFNASAASAAEFSGPVPPMAVAVATMIVMVMTHAKIAPRPRRSGPAGSPPGRRAGRRRRPPRRTACTG